MWIAIKITHKILKMCVKLKLTIAKRTIIRYNINKQIQYYPR